MSLVFLQRHLIVRSDPDHLVVFGIFVVVVVVVVVVSGVLRFRRGVTSPNLIVGVVRLYGLFCVIVATCRSDDGLLSSVDVLLSSLVGISSTSGGFRDEDRQLVGVKGESTGKLNVRQNHVRDPVVAH